MISVRSRIQRRQNQQHFPLYSLTVDAPYTSRQATYDLRRLRRKGLIRRLPQSQRYQLTPLGRTVAVLFSKTYGRVLSPGLAILDLTLDPAVGARSPLHVAWRQLNRNLDEFIDHRMLAAA